MPPLPAHAPDDRGEPHHRARPSRPVCLGSPSPEPRSRSSAASLSRLRRPPPPPAPTGRVRRGRRRAPAGSLGFGAPPSGKKTFLKPFTSSQEKVFRLETREPSPPPTLCRRPRARGCWVLLGGAAPTLPPSASSSPPAGLERWFAGGKGVGGTAAAEVRKRERESSESVREREGGGPRALSFLFFSFSPPSLLSLSPTLLMFVCGSLPG